MEVLERNKTGLIQRKWLTDAISGKKIPALQLGEQSGIALTLVPDRALDIYELSFRGQRISYLDPDAGIAPENFLEDGIKGFSVNFFGGFLTTCGLLNAGRPCEENGRAFGLHGCISNTACSRVDILEDEEAVRVSAVTEERHPQGELLRLERTVSLFKCMECIEIDDTVTNMGQAATPVMMMYHINFGEPFLSENLKVSAGFSYIEDRDAKRTAQPGEVLAMGAKGSADREHVYYTQADMENGFTLNDPDSGMQVILRAKGERLKWCGIWKNFMEGTYALGIEPCFCPGLGRVGAARRGLLPVLQPQESFKNRICVTVKGSVSETRGKEETL